MAEVRTATTLAEGRSRLRNVPDEGLYAWEPTANFGVYRPDTFYFVEAR